MAYVSDYVTAPYQGVSQAPPQVRLDEQAEALENLLVAIPQGATKRPPLSWQGILGGHPGHSNGVLERIEREGVDDALLTITLDGPGAVFPRLYLLSSFPVVGLSNAEVAAETLTASVDALSYLSQGVTNPQEDIGVLTVEDYTFIWNRKVTVAKQTGTAPPRAPEGMVWVRTAAYARTFSVTVTGVDITTVTASVHTPNGATEADGDWVDTEVIANALISGGYTTIDGASASGALSELISQGFTVSQTGPVIYLSHPTKDFQIAVADGQGGGAMLAIKGKVQNFSDLPVKAVQGFTVRITQQSGSDQDDFFVRYNETAGPGTGVWEETIGPGAELGLDPKTMPVGLVYDGGWQLKVLDWKPRQVGDQNLNPDPGFIATIIRDMSFWRGRLALISSENIMLSSAEDPLRFYPKTLSSVLDSDPIDFFSPYPTRSTFRFGLPFDTKLLGFADIFQGEVVTSQKLSSGTADIDVLTTFEFSPLARPQASNGKAYFVAPHGTDYSTVYEMYPNRVTNVTDGEDMTISTPRYLPGGVDRVASCPVNYMIAYGVSGQPSLVFHLFRYAEQQRVQNAWMRWSLPDGYTLGGSFFQNTRLHLLGVTGSKAHLLISDTAPSLLDPGSSRLLTYLDLRASEGQVGVAYDTALDQSTITLPWTATAATRLSIRAPGGQGGPSYSTVDPLPVLPEGSLADVVSYAGNTVVVMGRYTGVNFWVGQSYTARHRLSTLYAKDTQGNPQRSGRLSIRRVTVDVANTGYLRAEVTARGRPTRSYIFSGYILDDPGSLFNTAPSATAEFTFPVGTQNTQATIDLINDSHFGSSVLGMEWRGQFNPKAQRAG